MEKEKIVLLLTMLTIIFVSGCIRAPSSGVEIKDVKYQTGNILLTLQSNQSVETVRIDILGSQGQVLCSKYKDLSAGANQIELTECEIEKEVKVSVSPPGQPAVVKKIKLDIPEPTVKIQDVKYDLGELVTTLNANIETKSVRLEVVSGGNVLCTKYIDLKQGTNQIKLSECGTEEKITISITPSGGSLTTKDFTLEIPFFLLKKGFKYDYSGSTSSSPFGDISIYVTEETAAAWEGIASIKERSSSTSAYLIRYKISKSDLSLLTTYPLGADKITLSTVDYKPLRDITGSSEVTNALIPFYMIIWKEQVLLNIDELFQKKTTVFSQSSEERIIFKIDSTPIRNKFSVYKIVVTRTREDQTANILELYTSTVKPYLLMDALVFDGTGGLTFKSLEKKDFSLGDYAGYTIEEYKPSIPLVEREIPVQSPT